MNTRVITVPAAKPHPSSRFLSRMVQMCQELVAEVQQARAMREVLCCFANPEGQQRLRLDQELRAIEEANRRSGSTLRISTCWATRIDDIANRVLEDRPDVIHFAGHGDRGGLWLEGTEGHPQRVEVEPLIDLLAGCPPRCLVLNACHSAEALRGAGPIPYVIGMSGPSVDEGSILFSRRFYTALAHGRDIETAFDHASHCLRATGYEDTCRPRLLS